MYRRYAGLFSFKSDNARNKKAQNAPSDQPAGQFAEPLRQGAYFQQGVVTGEIQQVVITNVHAGFAGFGDQLQQTAELPVEDGIACRGPPPRSTDASISAADRRRDTMKTTLDGVVFLLPHVSGHAKNGVSPQADFPRTERRARKRHAPFGRVGRAAGGGRQGGRTARWQGSGRQATRQRAARRRAARRRAARRQSSRTAKWQGGKVAGRQSGRAARRQSGRTAKWQDGKVAGRQGGRTAVGRAAEKEGIAIFFEKN